MYPKYAKHGELCLCEICVFHEDVHAVEISFQNLSSNYAYLEQYNCHQKKISLSQ